MKSIVELLIDDSTGKKPIHRIQDKFEKDLNELKIKFQVEQSASRDYEDGPMTDLRTQDAYPKDGDIYQRLLPYLSSLKEQNLIRFEIQTNDAQKVRFIITQVEYPKILEAHASFVQQTNNVLSLVRQTQEKSYFSQSTSNLFSHIQEIPTIELSKQIIEAMPEAKAEETIETKEEEEKPVFIYQLNQEGKADEINKIIATCNQIFGLTQPYSFSLQKSTNLQFPLDLRVSLPKHDPLNTNIKKKIKGFAILHGDEAIQIKNDKANDNCTYIIKSVRLSELYVREKSANVDVTEDNLKKTIELFKKVFADSTYDFFANDLVVVDGTESTTRPYSHIRSKHFWPEKESNEIEDKVLLPLKKAGVIECGLKPGTVLKSCPGQVYSSVAYKKIPGSQFIINLCNLGKLENALQNIELTIKDNQTSIRKHSHTN